MSEWFPSLQDRINLDQQNLADRAKNDFNPNQFMADSEGVKSNKQGFDPSIALAGTGQALASVVPGGPLLANAAQGIYNAATNQDPTSAEEITEAESGTLLDYPEQPDYANARLQIGNQALESLAQQKQAIAQAPVPRGMGGKQRKELEDEAFGLIDEQKNIIDQEQEQRLVEYEKADARIQDYQSRITRINEEHQSRLLEIQREEEVADFVANHPNAREGDLIAAYEKMNDPNTSDEERARLSTALERSKEINPYRMLQTPGGMLAAVASIIVGGLNRDKDPSAMLNKALQNDLALQRQRQKQRRDKLEKLAAKKGQSKELAQYLTQQESLEMDVFERRQAMALEKLSMMTKNDNSRVALQGQALQLKEQIAQRKAAARAQAAQIRQAREMASVQAQEKAVQAQMASDERLIQDRVPIGGLYIQPAPGKKPSAAEKAKVQEAAVKYGQAVGGIRQIRDAMKRWESGSMFTKADMNNLRALIEQANMQEGKRLFGAMSQTELKSLERMALANPSGRGLNWATGKLRDLKRGLARTEESAIRQLEPVVNSSGYEFPRPGRELGQDGFIQTANLD